MERINLIKENYKNYYFEKSRDFEISKDLIG